jgi:hypothetical protein
MNWSQHGDEGAPNQDGPGRASLGGQHVASEPPASPGGCLSDVDIGQQMVR